MRAVQHTGPRPAPKRTNMKFILPALALALLLGVAHAGYLHGGWSAPSYRRTVYAAPSYSYGKGWGGYGSGWSGYNKGWPSYSSGWSGYGGGWPGYSSYGGYGSYGGGYSSSYGHGDGWGNDWSSGWW